jgi:hypothetical protein
MPGNSICQLGHHTANWDITRSFLLRLQNEVGRGELVLFEQADLNIEGRWLDRR